VQNIFFECDSEIDLRFADGLTADEVYQCTVALYDRQIAALRAVGEIYAAGTLEANRHHLCAPSVDPRWGDVAASL
jgi:hypothetical protein